MILLSQKHKQVLLLANNFSRIIKIRSMQSVTKFLTDVVRTAPIPVIIVATKKISEGLDSKPKVEVHAGLSSAAPAPKAIKDISFENVTGKAADRKDGLFTDVGEALPRGEFGRAIGAPLEVPVGAPQQARGEEPPHQLHFLDLENCLSIEWLFSSFFTLLCLSLTICY